jgi:protein-tyrosine phosphatase
VLRRLRAALRHLRHTPDRLRHAGRRRRALAAAGASGARTLLHICYGNICRSPYAEYAARQRRPDLAHRSAGAFGPDRPASDTAIAVAAERGVDLRPHCSRLVDAAQVAEAGLVLVMDERQQEVLMRRFGVPEAKVLVLGDFDPNPIETRAIPDPYGNPAEVFRACYARIDRCLDALLAVLPRSS